MVFSSELVNFILSLLKGLTVKFWNVYGIEKDMDKAHVITVRDLKRVVLR